ncbi:hypothetical protein [Novosphingobium sp. NDB2Meth1]|uniref:hypothetical protein n=1 Tax=Novosphingobium sp. NDB2Meth1 TaxID=1892847 RepID=UPI001160433D|nr:hypothetical protein [Novosphingobium sp. NDB2Meth1]
MAETILAWADLDTSISRLILLLFGVRDDAGSILIGNMDLKTKVEKIKLLHAHYGLDDHAKSFAALSSKMQEFSKCRNTVAHRKCIGKSLSDPTRLIFISAKHVKGQPDVFEMLSVDHSELIASAFFARQASQSIADMIGEIEDARDGTQA